MLKKNKEDKPKKCKCGKMIKRPVSNRSGLCCSCRMKGDDEKRRVARKNRTANAEEANNKVNCERHGLTLKENGECYKCKITPSKQNVSENE